MSTQASDGQSSGQGSPEGGETSGGGATSSGGSSKIEDLEARFDLLNDNFSELRQAILANRNGSPVKQEMEELSDDEPLTASKINRIVEKNLTKVVANTAQVNQRQQWDDKAKSEFPLADPKFLREFKREWKEQVESGLDPQHPKAIYKVAKDTARNVGVKKDPASREEESAQTSEAPTGNGARRVERQTSRSSVGDDDPRLRFYQMKGNLPKEKIEALKKKLGERDAKKRGTR